MADNERSQRPVRKLTVKNFSVIKDAELEFGKITVLIGPEASGKSLLCKLAYFLSRECLFIAEGRIRLGQDYSAFQEAVKREFEKWFPRTGWGASDWAVSLEAGSYTTRISGTGSVLKMFSFSAEFEAAYVHGRDTSFPNNLYLPALELRGLSGRGVWDRATYIPSERTYFVDTNKGYRSLASDPDPLTKSFAAYYDNSRDPAIPKMRMRSFLRGDLIAGEDSWLFAFDDGRRLPLSELSSGSKELLPLLLVLEMYEHQRPSTLQQIESGTAQSIWFTFDDFFVEEPEAHVFPATQQALVRYFTEMTNDRQIRPHFTITTHSPYVLSAFGNLIKAGDIAKDMPSHTPSVESIIPRKYWIDREEFRAYALKPSQDEPSKFILVSIFDRDTGELNGDYLDDVSSEIAEEFSKLLELQYGG
ncbi:MAG: AAA family ATPase [Terracidiphilus sp.]|nr:AAA family ATPase [Terracidiphilus sp.]